ncbi:hypothetical protein ABVK25_004312 [Lepraria finkii]|uniref:Uncharacterized protein n=1 Tax=Lepraria finkii TaxID=1340010 RepID=A0ABR4BFB4_9LECA
MYAPTSWKGALALPIFACIVHSRQYLPLIDGQCTPLVQTLTVSGNVADLNATFQLQGFPNFASFDSTTFGGAEANKSGRYNGAGFYGNLNFVSPGRDALVFADTLGCAYSHIDAGIFYAGSFCCGHCDCGALSAGNAALAMPRWQCRACQKRSHNDYHHTHSENLDTNVRSRVTMPLSLILSLVSLSAK